MLSSRGYGWISYTVYLVGGGDSEAWHGPGHPDADGDQHHQADEERVSAHHNYTSFFYKYKLIQVSLYLNTL